MDKLILHCCINGSRRRDQNAAIPYTPEEIAEEARRAVDAGAAVVHIHARTPDGGVTHDPAIYAAVARAFRARTDAILNFTAGRRAGMPLDLVTAYLDVPRPPDMITLNLGNIHYATADGSGWTEGAIPMGINDAMRLLDLCHTRGIAPEPAILDYSWLNNAVWLARQGKLRRTRYFMVEFAQLPGTVPMHHMPATVRGFHFMMDLIGDHFPGATLLAHGYEDSTWLIAMQAIAGGHGLRIGLEDCVTMPDGRLARSNAQQIEWAVRVARAYGREPATVAEARAALIG